MESTVLERQVPFFNYPHVYMQDEEKLLDVIRDVAESGAYILQQEVRDFEAGLAQYLDVGHAVGVGNCTDGLLLALRAAGVGEGDEVIFSSHTFVATASAIHHAGATPVPVECLSDHLIDPEAVADAITPRTRAIMPTQLNGRTCDMDALERIARENDLLIIEDAAQALGATYKGRKAGSFGLASAFSFYPAKNLGCLGDGGAVATDDAELARNLKLLRDHGRDEHGEVVRWGMNSRLDNLQAAVLNFKMKRYQSEVERRRELAALYEEGLKDVEQVALPPAPGAEADRYDVFQNYEIEADRRDELQAHLRERGVGTAVQWGGKAVHQFEALGLNSHQLPFTEALFERLLLLPMNTSLEDADVEYVCQQVRAFYGYSDVS